MEQAAPAAPAAAEVKQQPAPGAAPAAAPAADPAAPVVEQQPERTFNQKELDEIVEKRLAKERRKREDIERRLRVTEELVLKGKDQQPAQRQEQSESGEPTRDKYATYEEFIEARAEWRADQRVEKRFKEREEKDRQLSAQEQTKKAGDEFRKRLQESAKDIEDFDETVSGLRADDPAANIWSPALEACEKPGVMLHHLIKNPSEAERIAALSPGLQAREMLKLEQKLTVPAKEVKPSNAPDPIKPVGGNKASVGDEMPDPAKKPEEWLKWRNRQLAAKARPGSRAA